MHGRDRLAATLVVIEGVFLAAYFCGAKFVFVNQGGSFFSTGLLMVFVSSSLFTLSFIYEPFEKRKHAQNTESQNKKKYLNKPDCFGDWLRFAAWAVLGVGGDIAMFFAVSYNAPLAESSLLTRGIVLTLITLGSHYFFKQTADRVQWLGIGIGLLATLGTAFTVYLSDGGVFAGDCPYWGPLPAWVYLMGIICITLPVKTLISRSLLERVSETACLRWLNVFAIPISLVTVWGALTFTESGTALPTRFWPCLVFWLVPVALIAVVARYRAQNLQINPVYHDGLRYGVILAIQFVYDLIYFLLSPGQTLSLALAAVILLVIGLSLCSSVILFRNSKGSTSNNK